MEITVNDKIKNKNIANGIWQKKPFLEQMANIGSEVYRAINWSQKNNKEYSQMTFIRSLELFDLSKQANLTGLQFKELCRAREIWVDFIAFDNDYKSTAESINKYFYELTVDYNTQKLSKR